jgi:hypothetical protein
MTRNDSQEPVAIVTLRHGGQHAVLARSFSARARPSCERAKHRL